MCLLYVDSGLFFPFWSRGTTDMCLLYVGSNLFFPSGSRGTTDMCLLYIDSDLFFHSWTNIRLFYTYSRLFFSPRPSRTTTDRSFNSFSHTPCRSTRRTRTLTLQVFSFPFPDLPPQLPNFLLQLSNRRRVVFGFLSWWRLDRFWIIVMFKPVVFCYCCKTCED